jgi:hypothetical protein
MNWIGHLSNLLVAAATVAVAILTYYVRKATQLQFVASMTAAFQNEWHNSRAMLMRDYLHSKDFENVLNTAIQEAYGTKIPYENISQLLERSELKGSDIDQERLKKFETRLRDTKYIDPLDSTKALFSAYQAMYEVLISFDRLAVIRDDPLMMEECIRRYKPPIRDLSPVLQAFIAVRIVLREHHLKNYKKDYMHLLAVLDIENPALFEKCKQGLIERGELSTKEIIDWEAIQQRHAQRRG